MNKNFRDILGKRFGRLVVLKRVENDKNGHTRWLCQCDCGSDPKVVYTDALILGKTVSCGCYNKEIVGNLIGRRSKRQNNYNLNNQYGIGYTNDGYEFYFDIEDYYKIKEHCWRRDKNGYIVTNDGRKTIYQHRLIMDALNYTGDIDHINHKVNDNRKSQLRLVTHSQNLQNRILPKNNTSGHIGVSWDKQYNKWASYININKKRINLGSFNNLSDAITAREKAEYQYFNKYDK